MARTVCPFCGTGCGLMLVEGCAFPLRQDPVARATLCLRGWSAGELARSPLRVREASIATSVAAARTACTVAAALDQVVERLGPIVARHGGPSVGILVSARVTVEDATAVRGLATALGTPHLDSLERMGCVPGRSPALDDLERETEIVVLGGDVAATHLQVARRLLRAHDRGATVRLVGGRLPALDALASVHVAARPGHELESTAVGPHECVVLSSAVALTGRGAPVLRALGTRPVLHLADFANQRGVVAAGVHPAADGWSAWEMLEAAANGRLRALLTFGDDPFAWFPELARRAFERLDLTVAVDAVHTGATRHAHVTLPGAVPAEKDGTLIGLTGESREIAAVTPPAAGWTERALADALTHRLERAGQPVPVAGAAFAAGAGAAELEAPDHDHPFLVALDPATVWEAHPWLRATVTAWREARSALADFPRGAIAIHPDDARALGVRNWAPLQIASRDGAIRLPARVDARAVPGTLWLPVRVWESAGRALGALGFDPGLRIPVFRPRAVRAGRDGGRR